MRPQTLALWLAAGVPFVCYAATASGYAYWLDSGEFVAASVQLGIAHPPGHPLTALWGSLFGFLPLGSLSFRSAIGQAVASALAAALHCRASVAAFSGLGLPSKLLWSLGVMAAWLSALTYGIWFQAVRPEVYALQTLCVAAVFERLAALAAQPAAGDARALLGAAFVLALGLANHHLIAFTLVPAFLPALWRFYRARRFGSVLRACGLGLLGLATYVYLPLRAAAHAALNLGNPTSLSRFYWVISAQVYAQNLGKREQDPLFERALDVVVLMLESFGAAPVLLALIGFYLLARHPDTRRHAWLCALVCAANAGVRAYMGPERANPDILGYLSPSLLALGTLAAGSVATAAWLAISHSTQLQARLASIAFVLPLSALLLIPSSGARASLRDFHATDGFDDMRARRLPPRAVVLASMPQTAFRAFELSAAERARPDVTTIALPLLRYPGVSDELVAQQPELSGVVGSYLANHDHVQAGALAALARTRPVFVELDTRIGARVYRALRPRGVLSEVSSTEQQVSRDALQAELASSHAELMRLIGSDQAEIETARQVLWLYYTNALHLAALGERELAKRELAHARAAFPDDRGVRLLEQALQSERPLDLATFQQF